MSDSADKDAGGPTSGDRDVHGADPANPHPDVVAALKNFADLYAGIAAKGGATPEMTDAVTQALVMILGSGPSLAAFDSLMATQQANGLMYHNAVANQQKTNLLGMAMTAKCVRYMLDPAIAGGLDEAILDEMTG